MMYFSNKLFSDFFLQFKDTIKAITIQGYDKSDNCFNTLTENVIIQLYLGMSDGFLQVNFGASKHSKWCK